MQYKKERSGKMTNIEHNIEKKNTKSCDHLEILIPAISHSIARIAHVRT